MCLITLTCAINVFPEIDINEQKANTENESSVATLQIVTVPTKDCPPGQKRLNGICRKVFLPKGECKGQDMHYKAYDSYRRRNHNINDDEVRRIVNEEIQLVENSAVNKLHALRFTNYPGYLTTQRFRRNVGGSNVNNNNADNLIKLLNEIKAIEVKENNLKQLWNGRNLFKKRRQEGLFLNTTAEKIYAANKARNTIYRAINYPQGNNNTKANHRFRIRRMLNDLNDDLNTINTKQFDDFEVSSLKTEELNDITSNDYSDEYNKTSIKDNNTNKTNLLEFLTHADEDITEELTSNESLSSIAQTTTGIIKNYEIIKNKSKNIEITTEVINNLKNTKDYEVLNNVTSNESLSIARTTKGIVKNYETFKNESKNIEITTETTKNLKSTKHFEVLKNVTSNKFHPNQLNNNKNKTNLPQSTTEKIDEITSKTTSKVLSTKLPKTTSTTINIFKHLEERKDDETSTQLTTATKETLGSRIIINRVIQRNEVEMRPIMQMMTTLTFDGPHEDPVLIQVPPRRIICPPHQRLARGRCRTRW
ncbi:hypothetical protein O3M35_006072 [Rhynocoris fuscipes]|uniref:Uncharacterized protein n=1 Tax=Rhynocoris fuscipes TaxID=488301 RepID=A0AAW1DC00_9HEMI